MSEHTAEKDAPLTCTRCRIEGGLNEAAASHVQHPRGGTPLPVCQRHGDDLLGIGWLDRGPSIPARPLFTCTCGRLFSDPATFAVHRLEREA